MGCGDVRLLKTIGSVDFTGQERAALNKLTTPTRAANVVDAQHVRHHTRFSLPKNHRRIQPQNTSGCHEGGQRRNETQHCSRSSKTGPVQ